MNYLIILFFIILALLSRLNLKLSVLLLIIILPSYLIRFSIGSIPTTLLEVSILIVFINWLFDNRKILLQFKKKKEKPTKKYHPYPFGWEIISVLIISFIAIFIGGISNPALGIFKAYFLEPILLFILIINNLKGEKGIKQIINSLALSVLVISFFAIWQKITGQFIFNEFWANAENRRVVSFFGYPNAVALFIAPIIPLLIGGFILRLKERGGLLNFFNQIFLFLTIISGILSIYFAKSKGALLALIISALLIFFILIKNKIKIILLIITITLLGSIIYFQKDWIKFKLSTSLSYQIRLAQWEETIEMLKDGNIFYGSGLTNYQEKIKPYHQEGIFFNKDADPDFDRKIIIFDDQYRAERWQPLEIYLYPHNIFLNFWTELGFLGMLIFIFIIIKFLTLSLKYYLKEINNKNKYLSLALFSSMSIILIHGMVDVPYFKNDLSALFWIIISLLAILRLQNNPTKIWKK